MSNSEIHIYSEILLQGKFDIFISHHLTFSSLPVTIPTTKFDIKNILHGDYIAFSCFVWPSEQTETFALHITYWSVFITEVENVYCAVGAESISFMIMVPCIIIYSMK